MTRLYRTGCVAALLLLAPALAQAQSAADSYFHEAARQYVADNVPAARRAVEQGLEVAPSDPRLLALRKKLRQGSRPDGRREEGGTDAGSQRGSQQNENASPSASSNGGDTPSSEQSGAARTGAQERSQTRPGGSRDGDRKARRDVQRGTDAPPPPEGRPQDRSARADTTRRGPGGHRRATPLSRAQAERLLRALEGQERQLLRQLRLRSASRQSVEKDW
jgi:hypothetical protein